LFAHLDLLSSDSFSSLIFFLLFSSLPLPTSAFSSVHVVDNLPSTRPSVISLQLSLCFPCYFRIISELRPYYFPIHSPIISQLIPLLFPYYFPTHSNIIFRVFPSFSYTCFPNYFPILSLLFPYYVLIISLQFTYTLFPSSFASLEWNLSTIYNPALIKQIGGLYKPVMFDYPREHGVGWIEEDDT
jgi:hypothetical protein